MHAAARYILVTVVRWMIFAGFAWVGFRVASWQGLVHAAGISRCVGVAGRSVVVDGASDRGGGLLQRVALRFRQLVCDTVEKEPTALRRLRLPPSSL